MPRLYADLELYDRIKLGLVRVNKKSIPLCRFWKRVNKDGPFHPIHGQCWMWTGSGLQEGYGMFDVDCKRVLAHRWAYEEFVGTVPHELCVLHRCDNRACVRPEHLFPGTQLENIQDMMDKGRQAKGEDNWFSKMSEEDVLEIRRRYIRWSHNCSNICELAEEFGVSRRNIVTIVSGKIWKHVSLTPT